MRERALGADRRDLQRRRARRAARPGRLRGLEGGAARHGQDDRRRERRAAGSPPTRSSPGWSRPRRCSRCREEILERCSTTAARPAGWPSRPRSRRWSPTSPPRRPGYVTGEAIGDRRRRFAQHVLAQARSSATEQRQVLDPHGGQSTDSPSVGVARARDRRACARTCSRRPRDRPRRAGRRAPRRGSRARQLGRGLALAHRPPVTAEQSVEQLQVGQRPAPRPARSSRATTAQRFASTRTWKRCSRGTHSRTSLKSCAASASSSSGAVGRSCIRRSPISSSRSHSGSQIRRPSEASSADGRAPVRWSCAWRAQITAHLTLPIASHQRSRSGSGAGPARRLVGVEERLELAEPGDRPVVVAEPPGADA